MSTKDSSMPDEEVSMDSVSDYFDAIDTDGGDKGDACGDGDDDDRETDTNDGATEMDSVPGFVDESETYVSDDQDTIIESDGDDEADAGSVPDSNDGTEMDSVPDFVDATDIDIVDQGDVTEEADDDREADASDGATGMDSVEDFVGKREADATGDGDTTFASDDDGGADAGSVSDSDNDTEVDSVPDFAEEIELGANNDGGVADDDEEDEYDSESDEEDDPVSIEQLQQIAAIPVAEKKYRVNTLSNLCVGKILSEAMAAHQATTIDRDSNGVVFPIVTSLERLLNLFSNPQFRVDLDNVYHATKVVSDIADEWFPKYGPVVNTLRQYGHVMALVAIDTPSTQVLATNYFLASNPPTMPPLICFGDVLSLDNMWDIMVSLCFAIHTRMKQLQSTCDGLMYSTGEAEAAISKHLCAFESKYLI
jgi:hypothetical protein